MAYAAKILLDSVSGAGHRLTTMELTYPRMVHSEFMTHRKFSRNAASSRAIPIQKMIQRVKDDPVVPVWIGKNQPGMKAHEELPEPDRSDFIDSWLNARLDAVAKAEDWLLMGVHKQIVNRILEPWMWITVICSATDWTNFFALRCHKDAQPEIKHMADLAADAYYQSTPRLMNEGEWHLPLLSQEELDASTDEQDWKVYQDLAGDQGWPMKVSVGRCARVSYLTHDGRRDFKEDITLCNRLVEAGHWSPFEHVATPMEFTYGPFMSSGNFTGWHQFRKQFSGEHRATFDYAAYKDLAK
jgi:thymidylate synthase ThyX